VDAQNINWLVYPDSRLEISLRDTDADHPLIEVNGNPRGFASLSGAFLWLSSLAEGHEFLSLTALPFVSCRPPLAFSVELALTRNGKTQGTIIRLDKHDQFQWQIDDGQLERVACWIHAIACQPQREYLDVSLTPDSHARLLFRLTSYEH